jgi:hypothetical protein
MRVCALVTDLMDRSKVAAAVEGVEFVRTVDACAGADVVIVDLARFGADVAALRAALPSARLVCFGPHVDEESAAAASDAGADVVLPRSAFFRDPGAAIS